MHLLSRIAGHLSSMILAIGPIALIKSRQCHSYLQQYSLQFYVAISDSLRDELTYWSHLSRTQFRKKIWPSPFTSDISIWCDAGAASWGATMENQKLQAQGFFLVFSPLSCGMAHPAAHCEKCGDFFSLESFLDIIRHKSVQIFTDNSNVVRVMGQGSTDLRLNDIVLRIISLTTPHMTFPCFPHGSHVIRTRLPMALLTLKTLVTGL